ncbi:MAG: efflux transporter periplasmic adaptor subunit [Rubrivivax sp.]
MDERTQRELRARVGAASDNVQRAASRNERARVALDQATSEMKRSEQLTQQGFIAPTKLETDRLGVRAAERELEAAAAERRIAAHELEQARAVLDAALPSREGAAAAQGRASSRSWRRWPAACCACCRRARRRWRWARRSSNSATSRGTGDRGRAADHRRARRQAGSRVRIERWGGPVALEGMVRTVEPGAFTKVSALGVEEQRVRVVIDLTSPREQWAALGDAFRVGVRVVTLARDDAVQVPTSAVFPLPASVSAVVASAAAASAASASSGGASAVAGAATHAAFVVADGRAVLRPLQLGARNGSAAWVKSGLAPGEQVIVYPGAAVRDGARVTARKV